MGEVYRARDLTLNRDVAIKILPSLFAFDTERLARFKREAQVLASLNHPNIATVHGFDESTGSPALILELVEGQTLAERLAGGPLPVTESVSIARQICEAVEAAHEAGIIHRDLKPANIKAPDGGAVKVLDFGLAKAFDTGPAAVDVAQSPTITSPTMTRAGVILGTAAYMAPEQARGKAADRRADIWAFGCVFYEMLTGKRAFAGAEVSDVLANVLTQEPDWSAVPADVPAGIRQLLKRCLEKDPRRRLRDIGEARIALDSPSAGQAAIAETPRLTRGSRVIVPAAVVVLTIAAAVAGSAWWYGKQTIPAPASRFTIPVPSGFELSFGQMPSLAISPDGRTIVYGANFRLYRRRLGQFESELIPNTDGAFLPFFSPDSKWIAFTQGTALQKIPSEGGLPVPILRDAGDMSGGAAWSDDGRIIFTRGLGNGGLWSVSEEGGEPQQLTRVSEKDNETQHMWPDVLPDGRILYTVLGPSGHAPDAKLVIEDVASHKREVVATGVTYGRYLDTGHLLYVDGSGTLLVQPFDSSNPTKSAPRSVLSVRSATWGGGAAFAVAANGTLVYATGTELQNSRLVELDRTGMVRRQFGMPAAFTYLALSPSGRTLATVIRSATNDDVHLVDLASGQIDRFSFGVSEDESPVWSPDGRQVAYSAAATGARRHIYLKTLGSTEPERLLYTGERHLHLTSWSPDGNWLAFCEIGPTSNEMKALNVGDPSKLLKLTTAGSATEGMFSPDGKWFAYMSGDTAGTGGVYIVSFPGLAGQKQVSKIPGPFLQWATTGLTDSELYFSSFNEKGVVTMWVAPVIVRKDTVILQPAKTLFDISDAFGFVPAADGRSFYMIKANSESPARELRVVENWLREVLAAAPGTP